MDYETVMQAITRQCAALVSAGQVPVYVQVGTQQYAALEGRLGHGFGDVEVEEPAGEIHPSHDIPLHYSMPAGRHVLGVQRVEADDHLHVVGSASMAERSID
jgi:hypothetical protein